MFTKFRKCIIKLNMLYLVIILSFVHSTYSYAQERNVSSRSDTVSVKCTPEDETTYYAAGDLPCTRDVIRVSANERLRIHFKVANRNAQDPYEYGYQELIRYKNNRAVERISLRRSSDVVHWVEVPFVRVRKQKFLADLDNDGHLEFAVFPFNPGTAVWGTARIYSLKDKIEFWGNGRYSFATDTFVQLNCMKCSKFNPEECKKCK